MLCVPAGCASRYVDGLVLTIGDSVAAVSRLDSGEGSSIEPGRHARFAFSQPIASGPQRDLAVSVRGSGTLAVHLFASSKDKQPASSASFMLHEGKTAELHVAIPDGVGIALVELSLNDAGSARLMSFSVVPAFVGVRFEASSYAVSSGTTYSTGPVSQAIELGLPQRRDASLIIKSVADGTATVRVVARNGADRPAFSVTARAGVDVAIPLEALDNAKRISVESETGLASVWIAEGDDAPLADLHAILAVGAPVGGDYLLYRWDLFPETLVFDFADYAIQDRYLKRLAFFAEKPGFRGRIASDAEIEALHGWNAHDYSTGTLAAFFTKVQGSGFRLNQDEAALLELLIARGILVRTTAGMIEEGRGAIISVSRESTPGLRRMFMDHESAHALFFQDAEYRKLSAKLWASLGPEATGFWMQHLAWRRYDTRDEYLRINELQAYLVQQPVSSAQAYYEALMERLAEAYPADRARIEADSARVLDSVNEGARALDSYLRNRWGLSAGKFGRVRKL